jgi:TolA-binding protein
MSDEQKHSATQMFSPTEHLTQDQIRAYLANELDGSELRAVEVHLVDCELCADAIEGYSLMDDPAAGLGMSESIAKDISAITGHKSSKVITMGRTQMIAASVVVLVLAGVGFMINSLMNDPLDSQLAVAESEDAKPRTDQGAAEEVVVEEPVNTLTPEEEPVSEDIKLESVTEEPSIELEGALAKEDLSPEPVVDVEEDEVADLDMEVEDDFVSTEKVENEAVKNAEVKTITQYNSAPASTNSLGANTFELTETVAKSKDTRAKKRTADASVAEEKEESANPYQEGIKSYTKGRYRDAAKKFELVLQSNPNHVDATYYLGASYLNSGQAAQAMPYLDKSSSSKGQGYYQSGMWLKALAYIQLGKKENAKIVLERIVSEGGRYKQQAADRLSKL